MWQALHVSGSQLSWSRTDNPRLPAQQSLEFADPWCRTPVMWLCVNVALPGKHHHPRSLLEA